MKRLFLLLSFVLLTLGSVAASGVSLDERFPPPDFGPEYVYPDSNQADPRAGFMAWVDTGMLLLALSLAAFFALKLRSRRAMTCLAIASLVYFGFYRKGCVCPIGATQNVAQALFDPTYTIPLVVLLFFLLPLLFSLLFGRVFCAGVCPLGALQELVLIKPLRVPRALDEGLGLFRYFYLGFAVLFAAMASRYLICEFDPFVGFFRMAARFNIWIFSGALLLLSMFVGRPYCRYLCPYSVLLSLLSRFSFRRVTITPSECVVCGLCRDACPYGAVNSSTGSEEDA